MDRNEYDLLPSDAAVILGVHRDTVTRWSDEGRLPCWRTPGGQRRYRRADLDALLALPDPEQAA